MVKKHILSKKYIGTTDPKEVSLSTMAYNANKRQIQIRKKRHKLEEFETVFKEKNLKFDKNDDRLDNISDISSEEDELFD